MRLLSSPEKHALVRSSREARSFRVASDGGEPSAQRAATSQVCKVLVGLGRLDEAATVSAAAIPFVKGRLWSTPLSLELHWLAACIADRREDRMGAAKAARVLINQRPGDVAPWNLFARTTAQASRRL